MLAWLVMARVELSGFQPRGNEFREIPGIPAPPNRLLIAPSFARRGEAATRWAQFPKRGSRVSDERS